MAAVNRQQQQQQQQQRQEEACMQLHMPTASAS
jgi:hypothetical protein